MEIDCPECKGKGEIVIADRSYYPPEEGFHNCKNCNGTGKIIVYTEEEFQDKILLSVAKNSLTFNEVIKLLKEKLNTLHTEEELQEAVKQEKEKNNDLLKRIIKLNNCLAAHLISSYQKVDISTKKHIDELYLESNKQWKEAMRNKE